MLSAENIIINFTGTIQCRKLTMKMNACTIANNSASKVTEFESIILVVGHEDSC